LFDRWQSVESNLLKGKTEQGFKLYFSKSPTGQFLLELYQNDEHEGEAAHKYLTGHQINLTPDAFTGWLKAYEFINQDGSKIPKRRKAELRALSTLRSELEQKTQDINNNFMVLKTGLAEWQNTTKSGFGEWQKEATEKYEKWTDEKTGEVVKFLGEREQDLDNLQKTYREKYA